MAHADKEAIMILYPNVLDVDANGKAWISSGIEQTVDANAVALKKVQLARKAAYPTMEDQLDMLFWDSMTGRSDWKEKIAEIKSKYPNPS